MDLGKREDRYYIRMAGRIERELGVKYEGSSFRELVKFVNSHIDDLDINKSFNGRWEEKKKPKVKPRYKRSTLAPAPIKPSGMFRKHGSGNKFDT